MKPAKGQIEVNLEELAALLERARQEPLDEEGYQKLQGVLEAFRYLTDLIGDKDTTISRLRALLAKPSTEKTLDASPHQRLPAADPCARHAEVPEEEFVASTPALEALVELFDLPDKRFLKSLLVADHLSFPWIREDRERSPAQLDELRFSA